MQSAEWYRWFGQNEAAGRSATYERLARSLADNEDLMRLVESLPPPKRQPNLLFATAQLLGAPLEDTANFLGFVETNWQRFELEMAQRSVQPNEAARTAVFLPLLAQIEGPVTLIEAGASAGLCLYPDRYGVTYTGSSCQRVGNVDSPVQIEVVADGPMPPVERDLTL